MNWKSIKNRFLAEAGVRQLLIVECCANSREAKARYYLKDDSKWKLAGRCRAFIGKNGLGKVREGDAKTPEGELGVLRAFGIKPDPGCSLPYLRVVPGTIACDEEGPFYNRIVQTGTLPVTSEQGLDGISIPGGERMWELSPEYDYGLETDFNAAGEWPLGSAIFIHCKGAKQWTGGCVALDKRLMKKILQTAGSGLKVSIH